MSTSAAFSARSCRKRLSTSAVRQADGTWAPHDVVLEREDSPGVFGVTAFHNCIIQVSEE